MLNRLLKLLIVFFALLVTFAPTAFATNSPVPQRERQPRASLRLETIMRAPLSALERTRLMREMRHELVTLPFYDVFDWLEGEVRADGTVLLRGRVVRPTTKSDAEARVRGIKRVARVENEFELLPVSPNDDRIRTALYHAIYNFDSPHFRDATRAVPPIDIIVKNGRATLKGVVATEQESQLAYTAARGVPGVFEVTNELRVESQQAR
jgi:hyperosmotically inducible protein